MSSPAIVFKIENAQFGSFQWEMSERAEEMLGEVNVVDLARVLIWIEENMAAEDIADLAWAWQEVVANAFKKILATMPPT